MNDQIKESLTDLLKSAEVLSSDVGTTVEELLREGMENPLSTDEVRTLLTKTIEIVRTGTEKRGDTATEKLFSHDVDALIEKAIHIRSKISPDSEAVQNKDNANESGKSANRSDSNTGRVHLEPFDGIDPVTVRPSPVFHERSVPVTEGFIRVRDIRLWDKNARLQIHLHQFQQKYGRAPDSTELLSIMGSTMSLPGIEGKDQFEIHSLAKSISVNGVRKPPIIDLDGTLLDGNRRVTACFHILDDDSGGFTSEEKQRTEWLKVWQLTDSATEQDRQAVMVSLNFEPDFKQDWPAYVKAQKVYEEWEVLLSLEPRSNPGTARIRDIRRQIARKFALSINEVTRYISMMELAHEFECYQVDERSKDQFAAKHRASDKFQYFDELTKGKNSGGVNWSLNQDDSFKHLVFDLLYEGKFLNWQKIRDLKHVYNNEDAIDVLRKARDETDVEAAQEEVDNAIGLARMGRAEQRQTGANTKIRVFTDWFLDLPVKAFDQNESGSVTQENLKHLRNVLKHVENYLNP